MRINYRTGLWHEFHAIILMCICIACCITSTIAIAGPEIDNHPILPEDAIITTVAVGNSPGEIAVDEGTSQIYVTNYSSGSVSVIDGHEHKVLATIDVGGHPNHLALIPDLKQVFVTNEDPDQYVSIIDIKTNTICNKIPMENRSFGISANPDSGILYLLTGANEVNTCILDANTHAVSRMKNAPDNTMCIAVNSTAKRLYFAVDNEIAVFDEKSSVTIAPIQLGSLPLAIAFNPATNRVFATTFDNHLYIIDGIKNTVIMKIALAKGAYPIAINPVTDQVFISSYKEKKVYVFDGMSGKLNVTVSVSKQGIPAKISVNPKTNLLYVSMHETNSVCIINGNDYLTLDEMTFRPLWHKHPRSSDDTPRIP